MAERRCFCKKVTESDAFYALPPQAQALYLHLCMSADDDGFLNRACTIAMGLPGGKEALELLVERRFLLRFDSVVVIKHWRMANSLKNDRLKPVQYSEVASKIFILPNHAYTDHPVAGCLSLLAEKNESLVESQPNRTEKNVTKPNATQPNVAREAVWDSYPVHRRGDRGRFEKAWSSQIDSAKEGKTAVKTLKAWAACSQWERGYIPYLENWLLRGLWNQMPAEQEIPKGASGILGKAELDAIQRVLAEK